MAACYGSIAQLDEAVGRLLAGLKEAGQDRRTIVVFVSDNGPVNGTHQGLAGTDCAFFNSNEGRRDGKGTLYEGGIRSPGIVRWKGKIKAGSISNRVTGFEDWLPTLAELAGAKDKTPPTDGISFASTLLGEKQPERELLYREFHGYGGQQSLRMGDWKLLRMNLMGGGKGKAKADVLSEELYNIATDPAETKNLAAENPEIVAKMKKIMSEQHANSPDFPMTALDQ
jgi:arylsulfatase A-like enzyme